MIKLLHPHRIFWHCLLKISCANTNNSSVIKIITKSRWSYVDLKYVLYHVQGRARPARQIPRHGIMVHRGNFDGSIGGQSTTSLLTSNSIDSDNGEEDYYQRLRGKEITRRRGAIKHQRCVSKYLPEVLET